MKRNLITLGVLMLVVFAAACATTTSTPSLQGTVKSITPNSITVQPATGDVATVNLSRATIMSWYTGVEAHPSDLVVGHRVNVWLKEGTQNASKLVITQ